MEFVFVEEKLKDVNFDGDMFYDLTDGGYIKPLELLEDKAVAERVNEAARLVAAFLNDLANEAEIAQCEEEDE